MTQSVIEMVREFHVVFGHPLGAELPTQNRLYQRLTYINEELNELLTAIITDNDVEIIDALGDLMYFVDGTLVEFGLSVVPPVDLSKDIKSIMPGEDLGTDLMLAYMNLHAMTGQALACVIADADKKCIAHLALMHGFIIEVFKRMGVDFYPVLAEIHRSNMTKLWPEAVGTHPVLMEYAGVTEDEVEFSQHDSGQWIVRRLDNNKVVKNPDFEEPQLAQFV
jgi:hypothetical protein